MAMTPLAAAPSRSNPTNFAARGDALMTALPTFVTEANALQADVSANQVIASAAATIATTQAGLATTNGAAQVALAVNQVSLATAQVALAVNQVSAATTQAANAASSANYKGLWSALTGALNMPASVFHAGSYWALNGNLANVTTATPGVSASWNDIGISRLIRNIRTGNVILGTSDRGALVDITSGAFTQTLTAAATLGAGWNCYIRNKTGASITLDPSTAELIDGSATIVLGIGETRKIQCDGTGFNSIIIAAYVAPGTSGNIKTSDGTSWVSAAPALASAGALGSYMLLSNITGASIAQGGSAAGSSLQEVSLSGTGTQGAGAYQSGTWRAMGLCSINYAGIFYRIA